MTIAENFATSAASPVFPASPSSDRAPARRVVNSVAKQRSIGQYVGVDAGLRLDAGAANDFF
ncbi:MAG: hypothetical protein WAU78_18360 [Roseiarcus sp.]|jgi:hypothetical protein